ncbi:hypothetical protein DSL64_03735 [Dyadobacter luteus]|uniref:Methylamine utilisation protein MauE domain-containing protein n=1 Tax=Dyadobacter luteus TaxID=2259619 RepID=A0A3D8YGL4_9BACT|nr:MauE/DoxX family redox-associated membrane protein [Dyadobacter luteus]REA63822.1 hypothetical protein DSL64_03735 [Dyadobacter luteus]
MKRSHTVLQLTVCLLVILFFYTALSKLMDIGQFEKQLRNQVLPGWAVVPLLWLIPISELIVTELLIFKKTRLAGLYGALIMMVVFTAYIGLVYLNVFNRVPCGCGGVIKNMGFGAHLVFNFFFLILSVVGIYMFHADKKGGAVTASGR